MTGPIKRALDRQRAIDAAREAVIAAARVWHKHGEGQNVHMWIKAEDALDAAVANLNRLEATDAGE